MKHWTTIVLAGCLLGSLTMTGCTGRVHVDTYSDESNYTVGNAEFDGTDLKNVEINWVSGSVTVKPGDDNKISIQEGNIVNEAKKLRWRFTDGKLTIQFCKSDLTSLRFENKDLVLILPDALLKKLELNSVSAKCNLSKLKTGTLDLSTVSGPIVADGTADSLTLSTVSGNCTLMLPKLTELDVSTVSGDVDATMDPLPSKADFSTTSGNVTLYPGSSKGFTVDFSAVSGKFSSTFATTAESNHYTYGDGTSKIDFSSVSGDLKIK